MQIRECEVVPNWVERLVHEVKVVQIVPYFRFLCVNNCENCNVLRATTGHLGAPSEIALFLLCGPDRLPQKNDHYIVKLLLA